MQIPSGALAPTPVSSGQQSRKPDDPKKIHDAAQQFESLMIAQMLKGMREAGAGLGGDENQENSTALEMAEVEFSKALSQSGGLGLAKLVEKGLAPKPSVPRSGVQKLNE